MASTFQRCSKDVSQMAQSLLEEFETHKPLLDCGAQIDYVYAFAERDDDGNLKGYALTKNGVRAFGITRKLPLKDRALGRGDAEIAIDGDWWAEANKGQQRALLDHELHHLMPKIDNRGVLRDDLGRPMLLLRKHDAEFGWFKIIAERHKGASIECQQAKWLFDNAGQAFWPEIAKALPK